MISRRNNSYSGKRKKKKIIRNFQNKKNVQAGGGGGGVVFKCNFNSYGLKKKTDWEIFLIKKEKEKKTGTFFLGFFTIITHNIGRR